ncbi:MAG: toll/interleukin-1 receptor domain-containing protein [Candidatus Thiodiazotropha endolucinida]
MATYKAFLAYSHSASSELAFRLQRAITKLGEPGYFLKKSRIFLDQTNLATTPDLYFTVQDAIASSEYLVLLASPEATQSSWVSKEVEFWLKNKGPENFLIALTSGEIAWDYETGDFDWARTTALPESIMGYIQAEPLWVDLRDWESTTDSDPKFRRAATQLTAAIYRRSADELVGAEVRRRRLPSGLAVAVLFQICVVVLLLAIEAVSLTTVFTALGLILMAVLVGFGSYRLGYWYKKRYGFSIFICYRRDDSFDFSWRLSDGLFRLLGSKRVFIDEKSIELGYEFDEVISSAIDSSAATLVVIGDRWTNPTPETGLSRLFDDDDPVRREIRASLRRNLLIVPVLIEGTKLPKVDELPDDIQFLAARQKYEVRRGSRFHEDVRMLARRVIASVVKMT